MKHEIERLSGKPNEAGTYGAAALRGVFLQFKAAAGGVDSISALELADGSREDAGCLTRDVLVGGPVLADHVFPGRIELPFTAGEEVSVEKADRLVVEGADFIHDVLVGTAVKEKLSLNGGKVCIAAAGQVILFELMEQLTPEVAGNVRIRIQRISGGIKP